MNISLLKKTAFLIILIIVAGLFIRIYHLGAESLWLDEGHSVRMARLPISRMVAEIAGNKHPPVYFVALHGWINLFGDSEFAVRSLSALFGVLAIFLLYQVAALIFDRRTGLLAALLLSLSSFNLFYSQEARMYSLLTLLSLGSMYYYIKLLSGKGIGISAAYLIFSTLLIYTQNFGFFIILAQNIYLIVLFIRPRFRSGTLWKSWIILQGILLLFYLPWLGILIKQVLSITAGSWRVSQPCLKGLLYSFKCFSGSFWLLGLSLPLAVYSFVPRPAGENIGSEEIIPPRLTIARDLGKVCLLMIWLFSLTLIPFLISQFTSPIYIHRATVLATLPWYIMVGRGISRIKFRYVRWVVILLFVGFSLGSVKEYFAREQKDQWREAVDYLAQRAEDGDLIYIYGGSPLENVFNYYYEKSGLPDRRIDIREMPFSGFNADMVSAVAREFDRVWVVLSYIRSAEIQRVRELMETEYYLSRYKRYFNYSQDQFHHARVGLIVGLFLRKGGERARYLLSCLRADSVENLVADPGFENSGDGWDKRVSAWLVEDTVHSGSSAIRVARDAVPSSNFYHLRQLLEVPRGTEYIFGAFVKTRGLSRDIAVEVKESGGDRFHQNYLTNRITGDNDWTLLLGSFEPGPGDDPARIEIRPGRIFDFPDGEFWVDDVFLMPLKQLSGL